VSAVDEKILKNYGGGRGPCTHAVPCTLIFGNASTNRRLSTERHRVEVNKPPDG